MTEEVFVLVRLVRRLKAADETGDQVAELQRWWPDAIPGVLTLEQSVSEPRTQAIVALALSCILPVILAYVFYSYWVFRGKVAELD
ncbi:hypothetical protein [Methylopila turkensis]|nr:hypothetical protein [Methylopila turkensis]